MGNANKTFVLTEKIDEAMLIISCCLFVFNLS